MTKKFIFVSLFFIALLLTWIFFKDVQPNQFIYTQDEFLVLTAYENANSFFTQNPVDLGSANTTILIVTFFDRLYYVITNALHIDITFSIKLLYILKLTLLLIIPFIGFSRLGAVMKGSKDNLVILAVSLFYSFNTFTLIYWHGNGFSLTLLLCYILAPLAFSVYHKAIFEKSIRDKVYFVILAFLMSFALYFFAVFCLLLIVYTLLYTFIQKVNKVSVVKNIVILILLFVPFLSVLSLIAYDMIFSSVQSVNLTGGETFGNIKGGVLFQLLMWFSWAIYTYWTPRNIYTFSSYFLTLPSLLAPFILYFFIFSGLVKKNKNVFLIIFLVLFLFAIFFSKGHQLPLGEIYVYLIEHSWFFRIFRSPDNKFGFGIVFTLAVLLILVAKSHKKAVFILGVSLVTLIQGYPIFSGLAIVGEDTPTSSKRILFVPKEYQEVGDFLNTNANQYGYVTTLPSVEVGHYKMQGNIVHIGQDFLPKLTALPFVYVSDYSGMLINTHSKLENALQASDSAGLSDFPIRYYIIRNDVKLKKHNEQANAVIRKEFPLVFTNKKFEIYENTNAAPIIQTENAEFEVINPIMYRVTLYNVSREQLLTFQQNFNRNWKLYPGSINEPIRCDKTTIYTSVLKECVNTKSSISRYDIAYLWKKPVFEDTHDFYKTYANSWKVTPGVVRDTFPKDSYTINSDGSLNIRMFLYFKTQSVLYVGLGISAIYLIALVVFLLYIHFKKVEHTNTTL